MVNKQMKVERISTDEPETLPRSFKIELSIPNDQDESDMETVMKIGEVKTETHKEDYAKLSDKPLDDHQSIGAEDMFDIGKVKIETHTQEDMESFQLSELSSDNPAATDGKNVGVESHKCNLCPKTYRTKQHLRHHIKLVHEPKPFECLVCQVKFLYEIQLKKHNRSQEHLDKLPEIQPQPPIEMPVEEDKVVSLYCSICKKSFSTRNALQAHNERHQPGQCDVCQKTFQDRRKLKTHVNYHAAKRIECTEPNCGKSFVRKSAFQDHLRMHESKREREALTFKCEVCKLTFSHKYKLTLHKNRVHRINSQVSASQVSKTPNNSDYAKLAHENQDETMMDDHQQPLQEHVKVKTEPLDENEFTLTAGTEAESFSENTYSGSSHLESVSQSGLPNNYEIKTEQSADLEDSIDIGEVKVEPCEDEESNGVLGTNTSTLSEVFKPDDKNTSDSEKSSEENENIATPRARRKRRLTKPKPDTVDDGKPRPFKCNLCPKSFRLNSRLTKHFAGVHGPKTFECDLCDASFRRSFHLAAHKRIHNKEKEEGFYSVQALQNEKLANSNEGTVAEDTNNDSEEPLLTQQNSSDSALQCAKCFSVWPNQNRLWLHYKAAHKEKVKCTLCSETFNHEKRLKNHMLANHKQKDGTFQPLKCSQCNKTFDTTTKWRRHKETHAPKIHGCTTCSQSFRNKTLLRTHERTHVFDGVVMECELCNKTFPNHKLKRLHMRAHAPKQYRCHLCNKDCVLRASLLTHMKTHEQEHWPLVEIPASSSLRKLAGNSETPAPEDNSSHLDAKKEYSEISTNEVENKVNSDTKWKPEDGKLTINISELIKHEHIHSSPDTSEAEDCRSKHEYSSDDLSSNNDQKYVEKDIESNDEKDIVAVKSTEMKVEPLSDDEELRLVEKPNLKETNVKDPADDSSAVQKMVLALQCNTCGKVLPTRRKWWQHTRRVHGPKNFNCHICGKAFADRPGLRRHITIHDPAHKSNLSKPVVDKTNIETPFKCELCQKSFHLKSILASHKIQVHGPKAHVCDICGSAFTTSSFLKRHMLLHNEGASGLECNICNITFPTIRMRSQHMKTHAQKKYQCPFCSKSCSLRNNLYRHMKSHDEFYDTAEPPSSVESDEHSETSAKQNSAE